MRPGHGITLKILYFALSFAIVLMLSSCSSKYVKRLRQEYSRRIAGRHLEPLLRYSWRIKGLKDINKKAAEMVVAIRNEGPGVAKNVTVRISGLSGNNVVITKHRTVGDIVPKKTKYVYFPLEAISNISMSRLLLKIQIEEARGYNPPESEETIVVKRREIAKPALGLVWHISDGNEDGILEASESVLLRLTIKNKGKGIAKHLIAMILGADTDKVFLQKEVQIGDIGPGGTRFASVDFSVPANVKDGRASIEVKVSGANCQEPIRVQKMAVLKGKKNPKPELACSLELKGTQNEGVIEEGKPVTIAVKVANQGKNLAKGLAVKASGQLEWGTLFPKEVFIGDLFPGGITMAYFTLKAKEHTDVDTVLLKLDVVDYYGDCLKTLVKLAEIKHKGQDAVLKNEEERYLRQLANKTEQENKKQFIKKSRKLLGKGELKFPSAEKKEELKAIEMAKKEDTYEAYRNFASKFPNSEWVSEAKRRASIQYWRRRLRQEPNTAHVLCQTAKAILDERGELGLEVAKEYYQRALKADKFSLEAYLGIVELLLQEEEYQSAKEFLERALSVGLVNYKLYYYLGKIYSLARKPTRAIHYYSLAIRENPGCIECLYRRGEQYRIVLKLSLAKADFETVKRIAAPDSFYHKGATSYLEK